MANSEKKKNFWRVMFWHNHMLNFSKKPLFEKIKECDLNQENDRGEPALFFILKNNFYARFNFSSVQLEELINNFDWSKTDKDNNSLLMSIIENINGQELILSPSFLNKIIDKTNIEHVNNKNQNALILFSLSGKEGYGIFNMPEDSWYNLINKKTLSQKDYDGKAALHYLIDSERKTERFIFDNIRKEIIFKSDWEIKDPKTKEALSVKYTKDIRSISNVSVSEFSKILSKTQPTIEKLDAYIRHAINDFILDRDFFNAVLDLPEMKSNPELLIKIIENIDRLSLSYFNQDKLNALIESNVTSMHNTRLLMAMIENSYNLKLKDELWDNIIKNTISCSIEDKNRTFLIESIKTSQDKLTIKIMSNIYQLTNRLPFLDKNVLKEAQGKCPNFYVQYNSIKEKEKLLEDKNNIKKDNSIKKSQKIL